MKSRLLSRRDLEDLAGAGSLRALVAALAKTPYRRALEAALVQLTDREAVLAALRADFEETVINLRRFYNGNAAVRVQLILRQYDVHNLKTVLRGLSSHAAPGEILAALLPVAMLTRDVLAELSQAPNPRAAVDVLASSGQPYARPLLHLRAEKPGATTQEMELRLDQWYFEDALATAQELGDDTLLEALRLEADLINVYSTLRLAAAPDEVKAISGWLATAALSALFVGPGRIPFDRLERAVRQESVVGAADLLLDTPYAEPLAAATEAYRRTGRLSSFERQLHHFRLTRYARLIARQPLAIGVVLGFLALKANEVDNLRWIANGIHLGMKPENIRAELVFGP
jgi:V/A-type H+/Na+-transporting ATPase subunit C